MDSNRQISLVTSAARCWELRHNLTPYDAVYVALAETLDVLPLTPDRRMAGASGTQNQQAALIGDLTCMFEQSGLPDPRFAPHDKSGAAPRQPLKQAAYQRGLARSAYERNCRHLKLDIAPRPTPNAAPHQPVVALKGAISRLSQEGWPDGRDEELTGLETTQSSTTRN
jgi:hypothetical protein